MQDLEKFRRAALERLDLDDSSLEKAREIQSNCLTIDSYGFIPRTLSERGHRNFLETLRKNLGFEETYRQWEETLLYGQIYSNDARERLDRVLEAAGVDATIATIGSELDIEHSLHRISMHQRLFDLRSDRFAKALCVDDIERAKHEGKIAVVWSTNGAPANVGMNSNLEAHHWIDVLYNFGIRVMHLTYNERNAIGDGSSEPANGGLSRHGKSVIAHLNELGIIVDTPHTGDQSTIDAAKYSKAPIMATHTCCKGVHEHWRGKSDDALKAIAETNGLVGIFNIPDFLGGDGSINELIEHIDYAVNLIGVDHVSIGTDLTYASPSPADDFTHFKGFPSQHVPRYADYYDRSDLPKRHTTEGFASLSWINWPLFIAGLVQRGYGDDSIKKIIGGNFMRVYRAVNKAASVAY